MNGMIAWFARNSVAANLLMAACLIGGCAAIPALRLEVFPEPEPNLVTISVEYRGAAPEEVEEGVCVRIEEQLQGIPEIDRVTSIAREGVGVVTAEILESADLDTVLDEIKSRIDAIDTFPEETEKPVVSEALIRAQVIDVAISGATDERSLKVLAERVRDDLLKLPDITLVELKGVRPYEISIEVSERALRRHGLRFDDVAAAVRRSSLDLPGGSLKTSAGEILLRSKGQAYRGEEFARLPLLARPDGSRVRIGDVATVIDGFEDSYRWSRFDGNPAVLLEVFRVGDQNAPDVARAVKEYVRTARPRLPAGIEISTWRDETEYFQARLGMLVKNGRWGLVLVLGVLALFMRLRLAFWVSLGIAISLAGAVAVMPLLDVSVNIVSLFAFILVLGILVDDAIVIGENIHVHRQRTSDRLAAAIAGAREMSVPVTFAVLTSVAAFLPLLFVPGAMGQIFNNIPKVVILCLIFSVFEALFILPCHLAHMRVDPDRKTEGGWRRFQGFFADGLDRVLARVYRPSLERALRWRYVTVSLSMLFLLWTGGVIAGGWIRFTFFPEVEGDSATAMLTMPLGTPVESTAESVARLEAAAERLRDEIETPAQGAGEIVFRHVLASVGEHPSQQGGPSRGTGDVGSHLGVVTIELTPSEDREHTTEEISSRWRELTGPIPDAIELSFSSTRFSAGAAISVELRGPDVGELREAAERVKLELRRHAGVFDVTDSFRGGKRELKLDILPSAEALGLSLADLARQVRQAFYGEEAQRIQRGRDDVRVMVRYPEAERKSLGDVWNLRIRTPEGAEVPFTSVAAAELGQGFATIRRADRERVVEVTARVDASRSNAGEILASLHATTLRDLVERFPNISYGFEGYQREQREALGGMARGFAIALLAVFALLAVPLRSYAQPLLVMSAIPFGLVGATAGHLILGHQLSMLSLFGMVALAGVVVNSSLVLVHSINRRVDEGLPVLDAVREGAAGRFRPVLLTSLTTFVGLTPMMLERSQQAQFIIPMAISLAFGVAFSALVTLGVVPCGYLILRDLRAASEWLFGRARGSRILQADSTASSDRDRDVAA